MYGENNSSVNYSGRVLYSDPDSDAISFLQQAYGVNGPGDYRPVDANGDQKLNDFIVGTNRQLFLLRTSGQGNPPVQTSVSHWALFE